MEMLVTEALNELKLLDKRISKEINSAQFVTYAKRSDVNATAGVTKEQFKVNAKAYMDSIEAMIERFTKIKSAITDSNSKTKLTIAGKEMTVADAIAMKDIVAYKKSYISKMERQFNDSKDYVAHENEIVDMNIDKLIEASYGRENKQAITEKNYAAIANPYREANEYHLVDPLNAAEVAKKESNFIDEFISTVDAKLQISNCKTIINI